MNSNRPSDIIGKLPSEGSTAQWVEESFDKGNPPPYPKITKNTESTGDWVERVMFDAFCRHLLEDKGLAAGIK